MFKPNDVILIQPNTDEASCEYGLFVNLADGILTYQTISNDIPKWKSFIEQNLSVRVCSLHAFRVASLPGRNGIRDLAFVLLSRVPLRIKDPRIIDYVADRHELLTDLIGVYSMRTNEDFEEILCSVIDRIDQEHMEIILVSKSAFNKSSDESRYLRALEKIRDLNAIRRLILSEWTESFRLKHLIQKLQSIDPEFQTWIGHYILEASTAVPTKRALIDFYDDEEVLKRLVEQEGASATRKHALERIKDEAWKEGFLSSKEGFFMRFSHEEGI